MSVADPTFKVDITAPAQVGSDEFLPPPPTHTPIGRLSPEVRGGAKMYTHYKRAHPLLCWVDQTDVSTEHVPILDYKETMVSTGAHSKPLFVEGSSKIPALNHSLTVFKVISATQLSLLPFQLFWQVSFEYLWWNTSQ